MDRTHFGWSLTMSAVFCAWILTGCTPASDPTKGSTSSQPAKSTSAGPKKSIQNKGSDTMIEVAQAWSEAYPSLAAEIEVSGGGSGVGVSALIDGTTDIANLSRPVTEKELGDAKKNSGKDPEQHIVGYDALAIYVHKDNPIDEITLEQLKDIYGEAGKATKWSDVGITVPACKGATIVLVSRQNNSGTYEYFREAVLGKEGKYKLGTIDQSGSKDVVALVAKTPCAIGYSGMGYKTPEVKFVKVKKTKDAAGIGPSIAAVHQKTYPISRPLYMYTLGKAEGEIKKYIDWVRNDAGQKVLEEIGYVPLQPHERVKP